MKAWRITEYGELSKELVLIETDEPKISDNAVLIEIHAASVNPIDYKIVAGELKNIQPLKFPSPLGFDASGIVRAVGSKVKSFNVGDEVFARASRAHIGTFAEAIAIDANQVALKPKNLSYLEAASIPLVGLTTLQALGERVQVKAGQKILIHAGSGGVGTFAIQYAKAVGLKVTTTTSQKNAELVKSLGADQVICYDQENYLDSGEEFDAVFDTLGGKYTVDAFKVLKKNGAVVSTAGVPDKDFAKQIDASWLVSAAIWMGNRKVYRLAKNKNARYYRFLTESSGRQLSEIAQMIENGQIRTVVERVFSLEQTVEALEYLKKGRARGKVVIKIK